MYNIGNNQKNIDVKPHRVRIIAKYMRFPLNDDVMQQCFASPVVVRTHSNENAT